MTKSSISQATKDVVQEIRTWELVANGYAYSALAVFVIVYFVRRGHMSIEELPAYLETIIPQIQSQAHWEEVFGEYVAQPIRQWATQCHQLHGSDPQWQNAWREFSAALAAALEQIPRYLGAAQQTVSDEVRARLLQAGYPPSSESLSRMAQNVLLHLEGVSAVLNGMRRPEYVADSMAAAELAPVDSLAILRNLRTA